MSLQGSYILSCQTNGLVLRVSTRELSYIERGQDDLPAKLIDRYLTGVQVKDTGKLRFDMRVVHKLEAHLGRPLFQALRATPLTPRRLSRGTIHVTTLHLNIPSRFAMQPVLLLARDFTQRS